MSRFSPWRREVGGPGAGLAMASIAVSERRVGEKRIEERYAGEQVENAVGYKNRSVDIYQIDGES